MAELDVGVELTEWQKEWAENMKNPTPLHPELESCIVQTDPGSKFQWDMLKHPLVFSIPYSPMMNFLYNKQLEVKKEALQEYITEKNWCGYVSMHERPYRFDAFEEICHRLDGEEYWELLYSIFSGSENLWQVGYQRIKRVFARHPEYRDHFMDEDERNFLSRLPDQIRVFRGHQKKNQKGFSWTLAYNIAVWFGQRYSESGCFNVSEGVVRKSDIIGLIWGSNEMEVVVNPHKVRDIMPVRINPRSKPLEALKQILGQQFQLKGRTDHGPDHWDKVDRNVVRLCQRVSGADLDVGRLFAIIHDSQRQSEHDDPKHGHRAADLVVSMYQNGEIPWITEDQFKKLEYAVRHHNGGKPVNDLTIGVCFDADRLDLIRVGIIPNPKLLSSEAAKGLICLI